MTKRTRWPIGLVVLLWAAAPLTAVGPYIDNGGITVDGLTFSSWEEYIGSEYFKAAGKRCGTPEDAFIPLFLGDPSDCSLSLTDPSPTYDPGDAYEIPVVVHIIENTSGDGAISDATVQSQIDILNEDFLALAGTNGENGIYAGIQFALATVDPTGNPTTGITRSVNDTWFGDGGSYWNTLAWDTNRYLNIYTNDPGGGTLGYVPALPQNGIVGSPADRVVILWTAFGRNSPLPPFHQGRTTTHEVGHYLGLLHTFQSGCQAGSPPGCYTSGDLTCDVPSESSPAFGCPTGKQSCGTLDDILNYMNYSDDLCMERFTQEQMRRMRCTLTNYRPDVYTPVPAAIFTDGFESGDTSAWSFSS